MNFFKETLKKYFAKNENKNLFKNISFSHLLIC